VPGRLSGLQEAGQGGRLRSLRLGKANLLLALSGLLLVAGAYRLNLLPEAFAVLLLVGPLGSLALLAWRARRGEVASPLLRHPFRRDLRPHLLQCLNHWLFAGLGIAALLAGTFALVPAQIGSLLRLPLPDRIPYYPLLIALGISALVMSALALVPRPRIPIATNVLMIMGSVFLAVQLVRVHLPPADETVVLDLPLAGDWYVVAAGRSVLLSHHFSRQSPQVRDAIDFVRVVDGYGPADDPNQAESWYSFGEPVLAPADGTVVSVGDVLADEPIGQTGVTPPHGNHIVLEIGQGRYAVLAHLEQGSALVGRGERVRVGQQIAAVGDSGNSLWPHLHFHVQDRPELDAQARTVPVVFRDVLLTRNGRPSAPAHADLRRGDRVRPAAP
jgi:hypothetical protein